MKRALSATVTALTLVATSVASAATEPTTAASAPAASAAPTQAPAKAAAPAASAAPVAAPATQAPPAVAQPATPTPQAQAPAAAEGQPLTLKPTHPLTLAPEPTGTPWYVKLLAFAGLAGAGFYFWRRHKMRQIGPDFGASRLRVLSRANVAPRTELLVVDAGGTRVLLGVTAQTVSTLAVLPDGDPELADPAIEDERAAPDARDEIDDEPIKLPMESFADRARALLGAPTASEVPAAPRATAAAKGSGPAPARRPRPAAEPAKPDSGAILRARPTSARDEEGSGVEGQARGLRSIIKPRRPS